MTGTGGPWFDDLAVGDRFSAPACTLTSGLAAAHQAIIGDRLALALDDDLARRTTGQAGVAHPALVWNVAIGQSTVVTQRVKANLFYRGLVFRRLPHIGDTLRTTTEVVGLRENSRREGRAPTGLAALRMTTVDQEDRPVLDFYRCAMLPLRSTADTGHRDDLDHIGPATIDDQLGPLAASIEAGEMAMHDRPKEGQSWVVDAGDVVSSAPELARLTLNVAAVHHDAKAAGGRRLVYGGHTIGLSLAQVSRTLPGVVTVLGWHGCDHTGPVHEGDTLRSTIEVERVDDAGAGWLAHLRSVVTADDDRQVLDWRLVVMGR